MRALLVRLRAPLMSFGAPAIDDIGPAGSYPTRSMLTGLLGCALGWRRDRVTELTRLQERIVYAVRCDKVPSRLVDLQTVRTYADDMCEAQVTPFGWVSFRDAQWLRGNAVMRRREYLVDGSFLVALTLHDDAEAPTLDILFEKLCFPEAVLTIGRRGCIPSARLAVRPPFEAASLLDALAVEPSPLAKPQGIWPESEGKHLGGRTIQIVEDRDWKNDIHTGRRRMRVGDLRKEA